MVTKTLKGIANRAKDQPNLYYQSLFKALYLLAFYACMRAGEAVISSQDHHTLCINDVLKTEHNQ